MNNSQDRLEPYEQLLSKSPKTTTPNIYSGPVSLTNSIAYNDNGYHYAYAEHLPDFLSNQLSQRDHLKISPNEADIFSSEIITGAPHNTFTNKLNCISQADDSIYNQQKNKLGPANLAQEVDEPIHSESTSPPPLCSIYDKHKSNDFTQILPNTYHLPNNELNITMEENDEHVKVQL